MRCAYINACVDVHVLIYAQDIIYNTICIIEFDICREKGKTSKKGTPFGESPTTPSNPCPKIDIKQ